MDISATMVAEAIAFNADVVASGRATFHLASVDAIPCADGGFDKTFAINVFYFWPDPVRALREMRRVLRPVGISIIGAVTPDTAATVPYAREELGFRTYDGETLIALHGEAGFGQVVVEPYSEVITGPNGAPWGRRYLMVIAQH